MGQRYWSWLNGLVRKNISQISLIASNIFLGVRIVFLPPYSPDLNPIEEAISKIKSWIRRHGELFTPGDGILYDVKVAMDVVTPEDAEGYFTHAGYF